MAAATVARVSGSPDACETEGQLLRRLHKGWFVPDDLFGQHMESLAQQVARSREVRRRYEAAAKPRRRPARFEAQVASFLAGGGGGGGGGGGDSVQRDRFGFEVEDAALQASFDAHLAAPETVAFLDAARKALKGRSGANAQQADTQALLSAGAPDDCRGELWLRHASAAQRPYPSYPQLLAKGDAAVPEDSLVTIKKDLGRTFPQGALFGEGGATRQELRDVLCCFAQASADGYCQGLNFIAGVLLLFLRWYDACGVLCAVAGSEKYNAGYYGRSMEMCTVDQAALAAAVCERFPEVSEKLESLCVTLTDLFVKWFLCLFVDCFPLHVTLIFWDFYFVHGIPFIFSVILAFIGEHSEAILAAPDLTTVMDLVREKPLAMVDPMPLVRSAVTTYKVTMDELKAYRAGCVARLEAEKAERDAKRAELQRRRAQQQQQGGDDNPGSPASPTKERVKAFKGLLSRKKK